SVREDCVRETIKALEVEPIRGTAHVNQLPWQQLQHIMTDWLRDCRLLLRTIMEEEFSLATSIFGILHSTAQNRTTSRREPSQLLQTPSSTSSTTATNTAFSNPRLPSHRSSSIRTTASKSGRSGSTRTLRLGDEAAADSGRAISLKILRQAGMPRTLSTLMHNANTLTAAQATPERLFLLLDMAATVEELMPQVERLVCWSDSEGLLAEWRGLTRGVAKAVLGTFDALTATLQVPVEQPRRNKWRLFRGEGSSSAKEGGGGSGYPPGWGVEKSGSVHAVTSYVINYIATYLGSYEVNHVATYLGSYIAMMPPTGHVHVFSMGWGCVLACAVGHAYSFPRRHLPAQECDVIAGVRVRHDAGDSPVEGLLQAVARQSAVISSMPPLRVPASHALHRSATSSRAYGYGTMLEKLLEMHGQGRSMEEETMKVVDVLVVDALVRNMEARAGTCNNPLLKSLFLVNNILYINRLSEKIHLPLENQKLLEAQSKAFREAGLQKPPTVPLHLSATHRASPPLSHPPCLSTSQPPTVPLHLSATHHTSAPHLTHFPWHVCLPLLLLLQVTASLGGRGRSAAMEPSEVNRRLHRFNIAFEDLALEQKDWVICDGAWRKTTVHEWAAHLKHLYEEFLEPHRCAGDTCNGRAQVQTSFEADAMKAARDQDPTPGHECLHPLSSYHWKAGAIRNLKHFSKPTSTPYPIHTPTSWTLPIPPLCAVSVCTHAPPITGRQTLWSGSCSSTLSVRALKPTHPPFPYPHSPTHFLVLCSECLHTLSSYHWEADAMERLVLKSFFATSR
ncbi:unnamed protein product, partial [Closterium sp. NIES-65]